MERKIKLIPYRVYKYCSKCTGTMEQCDWSRFSSSSCTATLLTATNTTFQLSEHFNHRCNKCGHGENYEKQYPYIDYIEDGDLG